MSTEAALAAPAAEKTLSLSERLLAWVERVGNRLPDPAVHFLIALLIVWVLSAVLASHDFGVLDPRTGQPLQIRNQLSFSAIVETLRTMVVTYTSFPPLGIVLVMVLGVGVAEHSGLVSVTLHRILQIAPRRLLTPVVVATTVLGAVAGDAAFLVMAPLGGVMFHAAGRHPLAGILAAFSANMMLVAGFLPSGIDLVLQGFTQKAAQILDPARVVNPLSNWGFQFGASILTTLFCWLVIDFWVEPRLAGRPVDGDPADLPKVQPPSKAESVALRWALLSAAMMVLLVVAAAWPPNSPLRDASGSLSGVGSPLMHALVPIAFFIAVVPSVVFGLLSGSMQSHKDVIRAMSKSIASMAYYMVMVFFAAQFIRGFAESNLGALLALQGGMALKSLALPPLLTLTGLVLLTSGINLMVASASAKWAMLSTIFVPVLMTAGISPEVTQLAYRIGDSPSNIITPLNPYFPLMVAFCARYVRGAGIGTVISMALPVAVVAMIGYLLLLAAYWVFGIPIGIQAPLSYP